jgi:branched-chain amino acid transport system substrate-binding protein
VLARWLGLAALAAAAVALSGCAGSGAATANEATGGQLAVYSSLPLQGPAGAVSAQIVGGEKLALAQAGGRAGRYKVGYVSLDDSGATTGQWSPGVTASNAKTAAQDTSTIAYIGDYDSAATAVSLPLINAAGIAQVSPASPYVGLTQSLDAGQDEPERFYPTARRTFVRVAPGDTVEAAAQVRLLRSLGVRSVYVLDDQDPFQLPLAQLVASDAAHAGIAVLGHDSVSVTSGAVFTGEAEKVAASGAQAVFYSGRGSEAAASLWRSLHEAAPHALLLGSSSAATEAFAARLGAAAPSTYLTTPALAPRAYPPAAQRVLAAYRRQFGGEGNGWALYGYEAMSLVLSAIRDAGARGNDRQAVVERLLATSDRASVLGRYSVTATGETTLTRYGVDRVAGGRMLPWRVLDTSRRTPTE